MKVKFLPQDVSIEANSSKSVMELAKENQLSISSSCNGMCSCAECRVYVVEGEAHVLPPSQQEIELIGDGHFMDNRRLSCQLFCFGDVTVDLSEQLEKKGGKKQHFLQSKGTGEEKSSVVGDILVQQDKEMSKVNIEEEEGDKAKIKGGFYHQNQHQNRRHNNQKRQDRKKEIGWLLKTGELLLIDLMDRPITVKIQPVKTEGIKNCYKAHYCCLRL